MAMQRPKRLVACFRMDLGFVPSRKWWWKSSGLVMVIVVPSQTTAVGVTVEVDDDCDDIVLLGLLVKVVERR